jgi:hypothetical protein
VALAINGRVPLTISSYAFTGAETEAVLYAADTEASAISVVVGGLTASGVRRKNYFTPEAKETETKVQLSQACEKEVCKVSRWARKSRWASLRASSCGSFRCPSSFIRWARKSSSCWA